MLGVMLDLETLGLQPDAAVMAIGAVKFNDSAIIDMFYQTITLKSNADIGRKFDGDTIEWWLSPDRDTARKALDFSKAHSLSNVLERFALWYNNGPCNNVPIWGNGSDFDNATLASCYRDAGMTQPWSYKDNRCFRTIKSLLPGVFLTPDNDQVHKALYDATFQAQWLQKIQRDHNLDIG